MEKKMDNDYYDNHLSHSDVSLRLADIQKRCTQLLEESSDETGLCLVLEDPNAKRNDNNPYDRG